MDLFGRRYDASRAEQIAIILEDPAWNAQRYPLGMRDRDVTCAPDGERCVWAEVADYSDWRWRAPTLIAAPLPCLIAEVSA